MVVAISGGNYARNCESKACNFDYEPVCGIDRSRNKQTFSNDCMLRVYACQHLSENWDLLSGDRACEEL